MERGEERGERGEERGERGVFAYGQKTFATTAGGQVMSAQPTTHIATLITALHGKPVQIVSAPSDEELVNTAYQSFIKVRYPDAGEDTGAIIASAKDAILELSYRLQCTRAALATEKAARRRAIDAFDECSEECEALRKELGR